jgi:hypothetical protein
VKPAGFVDEVFMKSTFIKLCAITAITLLSGCASTYVLDTTVQSFSQLPAAPSPATYRFDRLPSQQVANQAQLEAMADPALFQAGLRRDDANPRFAVQISARLLEVLSPWADPWLGPRWGFGAGWGRRHGAFGWGFGDVYMEPPWFHREVTLVMRDVSTGRVVYETRAVSDGPWRDSTHVMPAMFQAAMQGFPNPPSGPRRVDIQVPG